MKSNEIVINNDHMIEILKQIVETYGKETLKTPDRFNALLMDLAPQNGKERKLICSVLNEGIGSALISAVDLSKVDQKAQIRKCIVQITEDTWITAEAADYAISLLAMSLGIDYEASVVNNINSNINDVNDETAPHKNTTDLCKGAFTGNPEALNSALSAYDTIGYKALTANSEIRELIIPESIKKIKTAAFRDCINLESVRLPSSLCEFGRYVLRGCRSLRNIDISQNSKYAVVDGMLIDKENKALIRSQNEKEKKEYRIPNGITVIESYAFENSPATVIKIPKSVEVIKNRAFEECSNLERFDVDQQNNKYRAIEDVLYSKDRQVLLRYPSGNKTTGYYLEDGAVKIADSAFSGSKYLTNITFTNQLKIIEKCSFENCISLESLMLPASLEIIGEKAFQYCDKLSMVMLSKNILEINDFAFLGCKAIQSLNIPHIVRRIGNAAFKGCSNLEKVLIQENVNFIGNSTFDNCSDNLEICVRNNPYVEFYCRSHNIRYSVV